MNPAAASAARVRKRLEGRAKGINVDPATCDIHYSKDEWEFIQAMRAYQLENHRPFPAWSEALRVLKSLGYRKVSQ